MNIQDIIGPVDVFSAAVAIATGAGATIIATTALARTPRRKLDLDFELEQIKLRNADAANARDKNVQREVELGKIASKQIVEVARIESGMIDVENVRSRSNPDD
jgi:hypothetical protein